MSKFWKALAGLAVGAAAAYFLPEKKTERIPVGESSFLLPDGGGVTDDPIPVYCYRPATWQESDTAFIAFPGIGRGADRYRNHLEEAAVACNMLIACPDFTKEKFPHKQWYQNANMYEGENGSPILHPPVAWTFPSIRHVAEEVRRRSGARQLVLFGFSAGGQLIQRFSLFSPENPADLTVIASPGWFTMPDRYYPFPYGLKGLQYPDSALARAFARKVLLLVGSNDITQKDPFPDDPRTNIQGYNRMERMNNYFRLSEMEARKMGVPFRWTMDLVDGPAHEELRMTEGAMRKLCREPLDETVGM